MSGGLPVEQVQLVRDSLSNATALRVFPEIVETALFAIFTVLICVSTNVLVSKGLQTWPNRIMLALTLFMYAGSALEWAIDIKIMWNELNNFLPGLLSPTTGIDEDLDRVPVVLDSAWLFTLDVFFQVNVLLSDAVVLWRACVVWNWHKGVLSATALILTCLLGANIVYALSIFAVDAPSVPRSLLPLINDNNVDHIGAALFSLSVFANLWATSMVACKAWIHRRDIRWYFQNHTAKSAVENILTLLVESGIVYSIFIVLYTCTTFPFFPPLYYGAFNFYWTVIMSQISGMYPTLVVVLVALQKSHCEHQFSFLNKGPDATLPFSVRVPLHPTSAEISAPDIHATLQLGASGDVFDANESDTSLGEFTPGPQEKEHSDV